MAVPIPLLVRTLNERHPNATYELNWETPLQLLVGTILAAQCTDERVNATTPALFARYSSATALAAADVGELEELVRNTGFYKQKAARLIDVCQHLVQRFGGEVPQTMEALTSIPGIARKSANVVLNVAFKIPSGIIVDTHVGRVAPRMGLTSQSKPEKIEDDLMRVIPQSEWCTFGPALVLHGRYLCTNSAPQCHGCPFEAECPKVGVDPSTMTQVTGKPARASNFVGKTSSPPPAAKPKAKIARANSASTGSTSELPTSWRNELGDELHKAYWQELQAFLTNERATQTIYPPPEDVFTAFHLTPFNETRVLLLGQDPYHGPGEAHGLCFSVRPGIAVPPSLKNMYKELQTDQQIAPPTHGFLAAWAKQGILMLNAVLTVRANTPNSHKDKGWEKFTDAVLHTLNARSAPVVFVLWGSYAQKKAKLIDASKHRIIQMAHPSPLSARNGFFGSKPYSKINEALAELGYPAIDWELPANVE